MMSEARTLLGELIAARNAGSPQRAAALLGDDVRYWDCEHGELAGREAVAGALTARAAHVEPETIAAAGADAVVELQVTEAGRRYRSTEVYRLAEGVIVSVSAYFDSEARPPIG
jgi:ketosteroid isomerase-like protein